MEFKILLLFRNVNSIYHLNDNSSNQLLIIYPGSSSWQRFTSWNLYHSMERYTASPTETLEEARTQIPVHHLEGSRRNRFSAFTTEVVLLIFIVRISVCTWTCINILDVVCVCAFMSMQNTFFPPTNFEGASQSLLHLFQSILPIFPSVSPPPPPPCHFYSSYHI